MTIIDAHKIPSGASLPCDVCVIGSGAAGITIAQQLDRSGLRVLVLEGGGTKRDIAGEKDSWAIDCLGTPLRNPIPSRGRSFGGSTNLWFGRIAVPDPIDFERRSWVPHSGWPVTFDDIRPWLNQAAEILDVPHFDKIDIQNWAPHPAIDLFMHQGGSNLGVFLWARGRLMRRQYLGLLRGSTNVRVVLNATATELLPNEHSTSIEALSVRGPGGNAFTVRADRFVLAAGGLENPRLLLASTRRSPRGIGNGEDNVGRYYMDHPRGEGLASVSLRGLTPHQVQGLTLLGETNRTAYGLAQLRVTFPEAMQRSEGLLNHSLHAHARSADHVSEGYISMRRLRDRLMQRQVGTDSTTASDVWTAFRETPSVARYLARKVGGIVRPTELIMIDQMEQVPDPASRVTVNPRDRDSFGLPRLELDWRIDASTYRSQHRMHLYFRDLLARAGIHTFSSRVLDRPDDQLELWDMKHPSGTTRMAASPRDGVVDADCRVHGMVNLYVAGSSVFPTCGHANPTLLIVGLAARLAGHIRTVATREPLALTMSATSVTRRAP